MRPSPDKMYIIQVVLLYFVGVGVGFPTSKRHSKVEIVGGNVTDITKVPYQAAILLNSEIFCGAAIISDSFLLTACHCCSHMSSEKDFQIRVGSNEYHRGGTLRGLKRHIKHPKYSFIGSIITYDVCVLETSTPFKFGKRIQPVGISKKVPKPGDMTLVAGWGTTNEAGPPSKMLRSVYVPVSDTNYCENAYGHFPHFETVMCAGEEGKDACQGDSGGALTWNGKIVGTVSFGNGCARKGYPGVYANILDEEIRSFIKNITGV